MNEAERQARANIDPETLKDMERAAPTNLMRDIAMRDNRAPTGPSSAGIIPTSQELSRISAGAGLAGSNTTGWCKPTPLGPQPGINHVDRLVDAQDRRDRLELIQREEAMRRAGRKGANHA
jgi:hypothetical protein